MTDDRQYVGELHRNTSYFILFYLIIVGPELSFNGITKCKCHIITVHCNTIQYDTIYYCIVKCGRIIEPFSIWYLLESTGIDSFTLTLLLLLQSNRLFNSSFLYIYSIHIHIYVHV